MRGLGVVLVMVACSGCGESDGMGVGMVAHPRGGGGGADGPSVFAAGVTVHLQKIFDGAKTVSFGSPVADGIVADVASLRRWQRRSRRIVSRELLDGPLRR